HQRPASIGNHHHGVILLAEPPFEHPEAVGPGFHLKGQLLTHHLGPDVAPKLALCRPAQGDTLGLKPVSLQVGDDLTLPPVALLLGEPAALTHTASRRSASVNTWDLLPALNKSSIPLASAGDQ